MCKLGAITVLGLHEATPGQDRPEPCPMGTKDAVTRHPK